MYEVASRAVRTDAGDVERVTELGAVAGMTRQRPQLQRPVRELALQALQHTHTCTRLTALFPGLPRSAGTRKLFY